eukprot:CAMPEP_0194229940 /NCGR_PEP_ID=MMETSP0156-20130528/44151_1 /TAXON_ID=33649 /ORGANISM="Thalassionema nitzschioides, Strain L26-B" /LENGTH=70 /DNA_ID=CAMNT_0038962505 /DNA_START=823 /DNA_END=1035 /DNA_ORIENTATION=+
MEMTNLEQEQTPGTISSGSAALNETSRPSVAQDSTTMNPAIPQPTPQEILNYAEEAYKNRLKEIQRAILQ